MKARRLFLLALTLALVIVGAGWFWVRQAQRQYALNRQLIAALVRNNTKQALELVNAGADPNTRYNPTPVPSLPQLLQQFLHRKPPPADNSTTAFMLACGEGGFRTNNGDFEDVYIEEDLPLVRAMLRHGADVNATTREKDTALLGAVLNRDAATVALLLEHGAKVNAPDTHHRTPLIFAALKDNEKVINILLAHGAEVNAQDIDGNTALYYTVTAYMDKDIIQQLLAHGADINLRNKGRITPLIMAQKMERPDLVALLKRGGK